jgi:hypothetical protein
MFVCSWIGMLSRSRSKNGLRIGIACIVYPTVERWLSRLVAWFCHPHVDPFALMALYDVEFP